MDESDGFELSDLYSRFSLRYLQEARKLRMHHLNIL